MTNFECCKSKTFPNSYYICIISFKVYHKSCVLKDKNNIIFVKDFQLKSCVPDQFDFDRSILEHTVSELEGSSIMKDAHIEKLLRKNELFLKEVTQREGELIEIIRQQEELITRVNSEIYLLKKLLEKPRNTTETKSTQIQIRKSPRPSQLYSPVKQQCKQLTSQMLLIIQLELRRKKLRRLLELYQKLLPM
ncbi:hypothetical protein JTB14_011570 [Gonioctena quinquepunctata]|nr:hypothetical protein JTB14_011570 [Gonioctena quinquepunctata]